MPAPPIRFAPVRGGRLAYQQWGSGPDLVAIPPTAQNIEVSWEHPAIARMLERLGSFSRYLHFDKRGTGCSDSGGPVNDIDARVDDLRAVMDHVGIKRAHLFGASEGGPMTLLFAATYPDRVASVTLAGSGARMHRDMDADALAESREMHRQYVKRWGTEQSTVAEGFAPTLSAQDPDFPAWHRRYQRLAASADSLLELLDLSVTVDVRDVLPDVKAPVLLLHRTGDRVVPVEYARETAALLPNARLIEEDALDHFSYSGPDGWLDELERFITGTVAPRTSVRASATEAAQRDPAAPDPRSGAPRAVHIHTLGRFAVEVDGDEVPTNEWGSRRARTLCKRLVAARGWPVTRDELFDLLWPDEVDRTKLGARLSVQLSTVRRVLQGGVIADRETVSLNLDEVSTDLEALHAAETDAEIVDRYPGDFLPSDLFDAWTSGPRDEARQRFVLAARREARLAAAGSDHPTVVALGRRLVELDAYDEDAHDLVIDGLRALGEDGEAQRAADARDAALAELLHDDG